MLLYTFMGVLRGRHDHVRNLGNGVTKAKNKYVTTYQHTLAEGSSIPAFCPLNTPPLLDPPVGNLGNMRR